MGTVGTPDNEGRKERTEIKREYAKRENKEIHVIKNVRGPGVRQIVILNTSITETKPWNEMNVEFIHGKQPPFNNCTVKMVHRNITTKK